MKYVLFIGYICLFSLNVSSQVKHRGCFVRKGTLMKGSVKDSYTFLPLSPNDPLYAPTVQVIVEIQNAFLVYPVFFFYDDKDQNNALATDEIVEQKGPDGTILFGKRLFNREFIKTAGGTTIPIIMAHEYAHLIDFKFGALQHAGVKRSELFADYFAGLYMYLRIMRGEATNVEESYNSFKSMGDTDVGSPDSHGSPEERYDALKTGYETAKAYAARNQNMNLNMAINEAKAYVATIKLDDHSKVPED